MPTTPVTGAVRGVVTAPAIDRRWSVSKSVVSLSPPSGMVFQLLVPVL